MKPSTQRIYQGNRRFVDREIFRHAISHFASGVAILTTRHEGIGYGLTASAVSSLSLDPPMLLVCINKTSKTQKAISHAQVFAVNILRDDQSQLALQFARSHPDKFRDVSITYGELGVPILNDTLVTIECRVAQEVTGGTHTVFLAEVQSAQTAKGMPLTYFRGKMGRFVFNANEMDTSLWRHMQWQDYD